MTGKGIGMKDPAHPGGFIREIVTELELNVTEAAEVLGVTRPALSNLLNQRAALSPEMALRIEKAFGVSMDTLMRMQNAHDIAQARSRAWHEQLIEREAHVKLLMDPIHREAWDQFKAAPERKDREGLQIGRTPHA